MIQHPHQLHAQAALWSLRAALRHLTQHREALLVKRPQLGPAVSRPRSLAALARHDELLRTERAERRAGSLNGLKPSAGSAAPGDAPGLADLERRMADALAEAHTVLAYAHHRHPVLAWTPGWHRVLEDVFGIHHDARWAWMASVLPATPPGVAEAVELVLAEADQLVRSYAGMDSDAVTVPQSPSCPACGLRRLKVNMSAPASARWTIVCASPGCVCAGAGCGCLMDIRTRRVRHIWAADSWLANGILVMLTSARWAA